MFILIQNPFHKLILFEKRFLSYKFLEFKRRRKISGMFSHKNLSTEKKALI